MPDTYQSSSSINRSRVFFGLGLLIIAALVIASAAVPGFTIGTFGYAAGGALLVLLGLVMLVGKPSSIWWPLAYVVFGGLLIAYQWDMIPGNVWAYLPGVIILATALSILFPRRRRNHTTGATSPEKINETFLNGSETRIDSDFFRDGSLNVTLGGTEYDLRGTQIIDGAVLNVSVLLGGAEVLVGPDIRVESSVTAFLGGVDLSALKTNGFDNRTGPRLRLTGSVTLGGLEVK